MDEFDSERAFIALLGCIVSSAVLITRIGKEEEGGVDKSTRPEHRDYLNLSQELKFDSHMVFQYSPVLWYGMYY